MFLVLQLLLLTYWHCYCCCRCFLLLLLLRLLLLLLLLRLLLLLFLLLSSLLLFLLLVILFLFLSCCRYCLISCLFCFPFQRISFPLELSKSVSFPFCQFASNAAFSLKIVISILVHFRIASSWSCQQVNQSLFRGNKKAVLIKVIYNKLNLHTNSQRSTYYLRSLYGLEVCKKSSRYLNF